MDIRGRRHGHESLGAPASAATGRRPSSPPRRWSPGTHNIGVSYSGDSNFNGSLRYAASHLQVSAAGATTATTITVTANPPQDPSPLGQPITFTATVAPTAGSGTPTGTVTFADLTNGGSAIVSLANGQASVSPSFSTSGARTLQASYSGDNNFKGSTTTLAHTVSKADPTITVTSSANPSNPGQAVTFTAAVSGPGTNPTGMVTFLDGSNAIGTGTLVPTGTGAAQATFTTSTLGVGNHTITANYSGDSNYNSKTTPLTGNPQVVKASGTNDHDDGGLVAKSEHVRPIRHLHRDRGEQRRHADRHRDLPRRWRLDRHRDARAAARPRSPPRRLPLTTTRSRRTTAAIAISPPAPDRSLAIRKSSTRPTRRSL